MHVELVGVLAAAAALLDGHRREASHPAQQRAPPLV
jgi:hypothetical protein